MSLAQSHRIAEFRLGQKVRCKRTQETGMVVQVLADIDIVRVLFDGHGTRWTHYSADLEILHEQARRGAA